LENAYGNIVEKPDTRENFGELVLDWRKYFYKCLEETIAVWNG
jgi:hypothetical protein